MKTIPVFKRRWAAFCGLCGVLFAASSSVAFGADIDPVVIAEWPPDSDAIREIRSVAVSGNRLYLACGWEGLQILDVSDPAQPRRLGRYVKEWSGQRDYISGIAVSGNHAFLSTRGAGLQVIDVSNPSRPSRVDHLPEDTGANAVAVAAEHAYVAGNGSYRLQVFDISDPSNPQQVGAHPADAWGVWGVALSGNYAYLLSYEGFEIVDVSLPTRPERAGAYDIGRGALALAVSSKLAFVATEGGYWNGTNYSGAGLRIIDVSDPTKPQQVSAYETAGACVAVAVSGHHAFLGVDAASNENGNAEAGLLVIDISDPSHPRRVGAYDSGLSAVALAVAGNTCYFASGAFGWSRSPYGALLEAINISDPANPQPQSAFADPPGAVDVSISGNYAYLPDGFAGLRIIDIRDPAHPESIAWVYSGRYSDTVAVSGHLACVAVPGRWNGTNYTGGGLRMIDIANPAHPVVVGSYDTGAPPEDVAMVGDHAYIVFAADGEEGFQAINISDPAHPRRVGSYNTGFARALAVAGNHAYVAGGGLQVIDITDPTALVRVAWTGAAHDATSIAISGNNALMGDRDSGLTVIDISDPTIPRLLGGRPGNLEAVAVSGNLASCVSTAGSIEFVDISEPEKPRRVGASVVEGYAVSVAMSGNYAYAATPFSGLHVIDISRQANPQRVGGNKAILSALDIDVLGHYAYLASYDGGLQVIDITNPTNPEPVGRADTSGVAWGLTVSGAYAYVADGDAGLAVIDISDPTAPRPVGGSAGTGTAWDVAVSGHHAFVACGNDGMQVMDISNPVQPRPVGRFVSTVGVRGIAVSGNRAYSVSYRAYSVSSHPILEVIDISQPASPRRETGGYAVSSLGFPTGVPFTYAEDPDEIWLLTDATDPANPKLVGGYRTIAAALGVALSGHYAYVVGPDGLQVFDLSDRSQPKIVGRNSAAYAYGVALADGKIYLASDNYLGRGEGLTVLEMLPFFKSVAPVNGQIHLNWEGFGAARLQRATRLTNPDWQDLDGTELGSSATPPIGSGSEFFRLRRP